MRRLVALLPAAVLIAAAVAPASAQSPSPSEDLEPSDVRLQLLEQTLWNGPERSTVDLRVRATNEGGAPLGRLTIGVTLFGRLISRTAYEASLFADPVPAVVVKADTFARQGPLEPGASRVFEIAFPVDAPGIDPTSSGVYPLKVDLRSDGMPVAELRTPVVYLVREPELPLALSLTVVLHHPIVFRPDGVFTTTSLEEELAPGGGIGGLSRALAERARTSSEPVDVAVSPVLLQQLLRMRDGYTVEADGGVREVPADGPGASAAAETLEELRLVASSPTVSVSAMPFAAPQIPSLFSGGLARDLDVQLDRGREFVASTLETSPDQTILRPPDGALDDESLQALGNRSSVRVLALDPGTVEEPADPLGFAPPPAAALRGPSDLLGIVPNPAVSQIVSLPLVASDPVLGAHAVLGELAAIWQEQPGVARGIAMLLPEDLDLAGAFYRTLVRGVADAPWLQPRSARDLVTSFPPADPVELIAPAAGSFSTSYVAELKQTRRLIDIYRSMLAEESDEPDRLDTQLLLAESGGFLTDPSSGFAFIADAERTVNDAFAAVTADAGDVVTLTSRSGATLPVFVTNDAEESVRVSVALESQYLVRSPLSQDLVLAPGDAQTLTFVVDLKTTGRFPLAVRVVAPDGQVIGGSSVVVRSTAYSRIALIITIAAALVLVLVWARRSLPRRTR
ncbi:MAG TPA: DUF6049 family protein [Actinomycetota bacterium]|nr:DUF6049 family protein [Actinomycetota bacterium]